MEHEHEDLLRDGSSMRLRAAGVIDDRRVVVGFREAGQVSLYCGVDPVFQFNRKNEIRRVYFNGNRLAAESGRLVHLERSEGVGRLHFETRDVSPETFANLIASLDQWLHQIERCEQWEVQGGDAEEFRQRIQDWCERLLRPFRIAGSANA